MKKYYLTLFFVGIALSLTAHAQVVNPQWRINTSSSTITPITPTLKVPCANIVGGCSGGVSTGTVASLGSPLTVGGVNSSTIFGDGSSTFIPNFNTKIQFPTPVQLALGTTCGLITGVTDAGACHNDIYTAMPSSSEIDYGSYRYNYSVPIVSNISGKYVYDKGVPGGGTYFSFTPNYFGITAVNTSTKVITYSTTTALLPFTGEAVTYVGAASTLTPGTLYYVGNLNTGSSTLILYKNAGLTTTSTLTNANAVGGTLETPAFTYDIGNSKHEGWGMDGIYLIGQNNGSSTGLYYGGTQGAEGFVYRNSHFKNFYYNIYSGDNSYFVTCDQILSDFNAPNYGGGGLFFNDSTANSDEEMRCTNSTFADAEPNSSSTATSAGVHIQTSGFDDFEFNGVALDDTGVYIDMYDGQNNSVHFVNSRCENPGAVGGWVGYQCITTNSGNPNNSLDLGFSNFQVLNDGSGGNAFLSPIMNIGPGVKVTLSDVSTALNPFTGASQVTDFMSLGTNSIVASIGFANQGDTPGVQYLYGTRVPVAGFMTNAPSFFDSTFQDTAEATFYNNVQLPATVNAASTTLAGYSPIVEISSSTVPITVTFPTLANNTGSWFTVPNRGNATTTLSTATSTDLFWYNGMTSTTYSVPVGSGVTFIDDAKYWTLENAYSSSTVSAASSGGTGTITTSSPVTTGNVPTWGTSSALNGTSSIAIAGSGNVTITGVTEASGTQYYSLFASSTANSSQTTINWNNSNVQELKLATSTTVTFTNTNPGARYILMLLQDATGTRLVTWPSTVQWAAATAPTLTTTANKMDIATFVCAGVSSTDCYGGANLNYTP